MKLGKTVLHIEEKIIESTGWLYTYTTIVDTAECLRLNYYHGSSTEGQMQIPSNSGCVRIDAEYVDDASIQYSSYLDGQIKLLSEIGDYSERFKMFLELCITIVSHSSFYYDSISPEFYLGIHTVEGDRSIEGPFPVESKSDQIIAEYLNFQEKS